MCPGGCAAKLSSLSLYNRNFKSMILCTAISTIKQAISFADSGTNKTQCQSSDNCEVASCRTLTTVRASTQILLS